MFSRFQCGYYNSIYRISTNFIALFLSPSWHASFCVTRAAFCWLGSNFCHIHCMENLQTDFSELNPCCLAALCADPIHQPHWHSTPGSSSFVYKLKLSPWSCECTYMYLISLIGDGYQIALLTPQVAGAKWWVGLCLIPRLSLFMREIWRISNLLCPQTSYVPAQEINY